MLTFFEGEAYFTFCSAEHLCISEVLLVPSLGDPVIVDPSTSPSTTPSSSTPPPPLSTYHRYPRSLFGPDEESLPTCCGHVYTKFFNCHRKRYLFYCNPQPIYTCLSYHHLSLAHSAFVSSLSSVFIPKTTIGTLSHQAMIKEVSALHSRGTWELVPL